MKCDIKATLHDAVSFWQVATFCLSPKSCYYDINQFILFPSIITVLPSYLLELLFSYFTHWVFFCNPLLLLGFICCASLLMDIICSSSLSCAPILLFLDAWTPFPWIIFYFLLQLSSCYTIQWISKETQTKAPDKSTLVLY